MNKFFKEIKYYTVKFFSYIIIGISYILLAYPLLELIFAQYINTKIYVITYILTYIFGYVVFIIGEVIRTNNERDYNKQD